MKKSYKSIGEYKKHNLKYIDRYGDCHYKHEINRCVINRYGDVVRIITKK